MEVEGQQVFQDLLVGEAVGPAVGIQNGRIQRSMNVVEVLDFGAADGFAGHFGELVGVEQLAAFDRFPVVDEAVVEVGQGALFDHFVVGGDQASVEAVAGRVEPGRH